MMEEIRGVHNTAKVFAGIIDQSAIDQIKELCDQEFVAGSKIRIMPDVHAGAGCTIGTTMTITDKIVPNLVGVDIGCGMLTVELAEDEIDFDKLDKVIRTYIPSGFNVRNTPHLAIEKTEVQNLRCMPHVNIDRAALSIGTLGGGNHFIEVNKAEDGRAFLVVHSGSRHLGLEVAKYYQDAAWVQLHKERPDIDEMIDGLKTEGRSNEIEHEVKRAKAQMKLPPKHLAYVEGKLFDDYVHDMRIVQDYANMNRGAIAAEILLRMGLTAADSFTTIHNYIDTETMILRKGAVSAKAAERLLIPMNMRDGSLICEGLGNDDWNQSAPHGAGRLMSRRQARETLCVADFQKEMCGVFSTSVGEETLDECPMTYKPTESIIDAIGATARIIETIEPVYNFKASDGPVPRRV